MVSRPSDRYNETRHRGGAEEKANDSKRDRNKSGDVDSRDRQAMLSSSRASQQHPSTRPDRDYRSFRQSRSRSRSPWRPGRDRSRSPYRAKMSSSRSRSRSRSPYRHGRNRDRSPTNRHDVRGEKRSRNEDHYTHRDSDPRRFKTYYEGDASSPSMPAYSGRGISGHTDHQNLAHRSSSSQNKQRSQTNRSSNEIQHRNRHNNASSVNNSTSKDRDEPKRLDKRQNGFREENDNKATSQSNSNAKSEQEAEPEMRSEAEIIDERRKRRAETKARILREEAERRTKTENNGEHISTALTSDIGPTKPVQHPAVQALKESSLTSAPSTPIHDSNIAVPEQPVSPAASMPSTPLRNSTPTSPAPVAEYDPTDLTNHQRAVFGADEDDGPSAADYDPKKDMEEDQRRQNRAENQINYAAPPVQPKENDMFAEDDGEDEEDDMFAAGFDIGKSAKAHKPVDASMVEDLPDGHYRVVLGELLDGRYSIRQQIGKGMFGTVVRAEDSKTGQIVAIKIARNNDAMYKAGQKEIDMLKILNDNDPDDKRHVIRLKGQFMHKKHLCLVFENLETDLRETLKKFGRNRGINLAAIRSYAQQMFLALSHLKKCEILHADMKPDNILVSESHGVIKVCDLGTAVKADHFLEATPYLVSRFYRAPEVILGIPFDYAIDMWSVGCTLFELYTGRILFTGADNNGMLRMIQECRGKIPIRLLKRSREVDRHFDANVNFISTELDATSGRPMVKLLPMNKTVPNKDLRSRLSSHMKHLSLDQQKEHLAFLDLMERCLQIDPAKRISPNDALRHAFLTAPTVARGSH